MTVLSQFSNDDVHRSSPAATALSLQCHAACRQFERTVLSFAKSVIMQDFSTSSRISRFPAPQDETAWRPERCDRVALVLQGGGALGAYQAGVYQAMHEARLEPDWVSGVSIGAINAAIIAGNPPYRRLRQLRTFWELITDRKIWPFTPDGDVFRKARNAASSWTTMMHGQPGFFAPRFPNPWLSLTGAQSATSYYDNSPLKPTLAELVDFSLINDRAIRCRRTAPASSCTTCTARRIEPGSVMVRCHGIASHRSPARRSRHASCLLGRRPRRRARTDLGVSDSRRRLGAIACGRRSDQRSS
jgi:hypothetical protein